MICIRRAYRGCRRLRGARRRGFTLLEIVVVILVVSALLALVMKGVSYVRERAQIAAMKNTLHTVAILQHEFRLQNRVWGTFGDILGHTGGSVVDSWTVRTNNVPVVMRATTFTDDGVGVVISVFSSGFVQLSAAHRSREDTRCLLRLSDNTPSGTGAGPMSNYKIRCFRFDPAGWVTPEHQI
jgi:prepilin-type N-terminal cleavage/methylation domain-containing protein